MPGVNMFGMKRSGPSAICVAVALLVCGSGLRRASAQQLPEKVHHGGSKCSEMSRTFPLTLPNENQRPGPEMTLRAQLRLDAAATVSVRELQVPTDAGAYDSTISIRDANGNQKFDVPALIKGGDALRLFRVRRVCDQSGQPLLVLGLTAGWTDATQGFIVIRRSAGKIQVDGLPLVSHGKLVVYRKSPSEMELWSASGQGLCEACKKPYVVRTCRLTETTLSCRKPGRLTAPMSPNVITADIIEVK